MISNIDFLNKNFCAIILSNTNYLFINFCINNSRDFKIIKNYEKKNILNRMFNNSCILIINIELFKRKYLNLLLQKNDVIPVEIFGILYDNFLWEFNEFISYIQSSNLNLSNTVTINNFFLHKKLLLSKLILLLNKQCLLKK